MNSRGVILIVALWILAILTLLSVGIGYQMGLELKVAAAQRDRLKALALAQSGLHRAIAVLEKEDPTIDSLKDRWATGLNTDQTPIFEKISPDPKSSQETWSIQYEAIDPDAPEGKSKEIFAFRDEEREIDLNAADAFLLQRILEKGFRSLRMDSEPVLQMEQAIRAWRGDRVNGQPVEWESDWYVTGKPKDKPFDQLEELFLLAGMTGELFKALEPWLTIYTEGKVNVNTASSEVLELLGLSQRLASDLIKAREEDPFKEVSVAYLEGRLGRADPNEAEELGKVIPSLTVQSTRFKIEVVGSAAQGRVKRDLTAIVQMNPAEGSQRQFARILSYREE